MVAAHSKNGVEDPKNRIHIHDHLLLVSSGLRTKMRVII